MNQFKFDRSSQCLLELGGVTRRPGKEASGVAVLDANVHGVIILNRAYDRVV